MLFAIKTYLCIYLARLGMNESYNSLNCMSRGQMGIYQKKKSNNPWSGRFQTSKGTGPDLSTSVGVTNWL